MHGLKEIIFSLTDRCNLRCFMCEIPAEPGEELSLEAIQKAIKDASFIGARTVSFSGGEPLLRQDIYELISFAKSAGLETALVSNGTLISAPVAEKLFAAGLDTARISIEGNQAIHDALRGEGAFQKTISALEHLKRYHLTIIIAATVSRYNFKNLKEVVEIARLYGASMVQFQPFSPLFLRDKTKQAAFFIPKAQIQELQTAIEEAAVLCAKYGINTNPDTYLRRIPAYLSGSELSNTHECRALWESCPVNAQGDIYLCWARSGPKEKIGSLAHQPLCSLWLSDRHRLLKQEVMQKGCKGCMLSCYDSIFGKNKPEFKMVRWAKKAVDARSYRKLLGLCRQAATSQIARIRLRQRLLHLIRRKLGGGKGSQIRELRSALQQIASVKERLRKEINGLMQQAE